MNDRSHGIIYSATGRRHVTEAISSAQSSLRFNSGRLRPKTAFLTPEASLCSPSTAASRKDFCLDGHTPSPCINLKPQSRWVGIIFMAEARVARRLAAILAADVAGYSRLMGVDEEGTAEPLRAFVIPT